MNTGVSITSDLFFFLKNPGGGGKGGGKFNPIHAGDNGGGTKQLLIC